MKVAPIGFNQNKKGLNYANAASSINQSIALEKLLFPVQIFYLKTF